MSAPRAFLSVTLALGLVVGLSACGTVSRVVGGDDDQPAAPAIGIGVNGHLWRASLDTLSFLPLAHGVDVSLQAATKYLVGHSDAMMGTIAAGEAVWPAIASTITQLGLCIGPDDAFLASRGLRTLSLRMARHAGSGLHVARWLAEQPQVARVCYPPLPGDPGHAIWRRDFRGASGLMGVFLKTPRGTRPVAAVREMVEGLQLFRMGGSWGGFESLVFPLLPDGTEAEETYLRLHVGLEDPQDLIDDLAGGLQRYAGGVSAGTKEV